MSLACQTQPIHLIGGEGIQAGGGLVHEQDLGVGHQSDADVGALALPACISRQTTSAAVLRHSPVKQYQQGSAVPEQKNILLRLRGDACLFQAAFLAGFLQGMGEGARSPEMPRCTEEPMRTCWQVVSASWVMMRLTLRTLSL